MTSRNRALRLAAAVVCVVATGAGLTSANAGAVARPHGMRVVTGLAPRMHGLGSAGGPGHGYSKGVRYRPGSRAASDARQALAHPAAAGTSGPTGTRLEDFNGVSSRDSEVTNYDQRFEPPDQGLCAGNGFVIEAVNSAYAIYTTGGKRIRGPFNINDLFNVGGEEFTSDPRCYYDPTTHRWFATIIFLNDSFTSGDILVAVSRSSDPTGLWMQYQFNTDDPGGDGCPCFGDQPRMGIDRNNIYLSADEFSINGPEYNGGEIFAVAKSDLISGANAVHFVQYSHLSSGGSLALGIEPALSSGNPGAEFFLNSLDPNGTTDNRIGVWALTHGDLVASGGTPQLSTIVINSETYGRPPAAQQKGSTSTLDSGDDRMQQVQDIRGRVWGELTTSVTVPGDPQPRSGAAWFTVNPTVTNGAITNAVITRQGYVVKKGNDIIYPALQADHAGRAAMVFTLTGPDRYPSAAYAVLPATGDSFGPVQVAASGTGPYDPNATRWGDYSFASLEPAADVVWLATEYVPPVSSQTSTRTRNWGTRVIEVGLAS